MQNVIVEVYAFFGFAKEIYNLMIRMPVQYIIEEWDFRDLTLKLKPPVFIPRPETEVGDDKNRQHTVQIQWSVTHNHNCIFFHLSLTLFPLVQELVELVLTDLQNKSGTAIGAVQTCLEVGCGSGAISLSLLTSLPQVRFEFMKETFMVTRVFSRCKYQQ